MPAKPAAADAVTLLVPFTSKAQKVLHDAASNVHYGGPPPVVVRSSAIWVRSSVESLLVSKSTKS